MVKIERCRFVSCTTKTGDLLPNGADPVEDMAKPGRCKFIQDPRGRLHNVSLHSNKELKVILCQQEKVINLLCVHTENTSHASHT